MMSSLYIGYCDHMMQRKFHVHAALFLFLNILNKIFNKILTGHKQRIDLVIGKYPHLWIHTDSCRKCEIGRKLWRHNAILVYDVITYDQLYTYDFCEIETWLGRFTPNDNLTLSMCKKRCLNVVIYHVVKKVAWQFRLIENETYCEKLHMFHHIHTHNM